MTNLQLLLSIGIPSILVLFNIASSRSELQTRRTEMRTEIGQLRDNMHRDMVQLRDNIHRDMVLLRERVAVVETRQNQQ